MEISTTRWRREEIPLAESMEERKLRLSITPNKELQEQEEIQSQQSNDTELLPYQSQQFEDIELMYDQS